MIPLPEFQIGNILKKNCLGTSACPSSKVQRLKPSNHSSTLWNSVYIQDSTTKLPFQGRRRRSFGCSLVPLKAYNKRQSLLGAWRELAWERLWSTNESCRPIVLQLNITYFSSALMSNTDRIMAKARKRVWSARTFPGHTLRVDISALDPTR